jgi:methylglutaconyl-CoA hydratase
MAGKVVLTKVDARGIATITFNRPEVNNAYNRDVLQAVADAVGKFATDDRVRLVVFRGNGKHFQAGADLKWVRSNLALPLEDNYEVSKLTTDAVRGLNEFPKPTIALVHGGCFGGGTGVIACCDVVVASEDAFFAITEARWGLTAGPIIPQLVARMGVKNTRRYAMSCERFDARKAAELGLVDEVCPTGGLDDAAAPIIDAFLKSGPLAMARTKAMVLSLAGATVDDGLAETLSFTHAFKRLSTEAAEGLASFLEKRDPSWYVPPKGK